SQSQTQSQNTSLVVSIQSSSDPGLERHIFNNIASAGRQLGRMSDVLEVLIAAYERDPRTVPEPSATSAISAFRSMRSEIAREKEARSPERIIEALETLRAEDKEAYAVLVQRLRRWLDEPHE